MRILLDVRNREEFLKLHVKNAVNIPVFDLKYFLEILKNHEVTVYCNSGRKTKIAIDLLRKNGVNAVAKSFSDFRDDELIKNEELVAVIFEVKVNSEEIYDFEVLIGEFFGIAMESDGYLGANFFKKVGKNTTTKYIIITLWEKLEKYESVKARLRNLLKELEKEKIVREIKEEVYEPLR